MSVIWKNQEVSDSGLVDLGHQNNCKT